MDLKRLLLFNATLLLLGLHSMSVAQTRTGAGQRPGPEFWRRASCEPIEPRTKLEALEDLYATPLIKAFTQITTVELRGVRIDVIDLKDAGGTARAKGIVIVLREGGERPNEGRAYIDYDEIDRLLSGIDSVAAVNELESKLPGFEGHYRTLGDFEINVFRQTARGTAVRLSTGVCDQVMQFMSLDDLAKVKAMILEGKARLEEIR